MATTIHPTYFGIGLMPKLLSTSPETRSFAALTQVNIKEKLTKKNLKIDGAVMVESLKVQFENVVTLLRRSVAIYQQRYALKVVEFHSRMRMIQKKASALEPDPQISPCPILLHCPPVVTPPGLFMSSQSAPAHPVK